MSIGSQMDFLATLQTGFPGFVDELARMREQLTWLFDNLPEDKRQAAIDKFGYDELHRKTRP